VIAPRQVADDLVLYEPVDSPDAIAYGFIRSTVSPKEFFFPDSEAILTIERVRRAASAMTKAFQFGTCG